jgi:hypothetical protein
MGLDPGFHRGDDKVGMTGTRVDFQSTSERKIMNHFVVILVFLVVCGFASLGLNEIDRRSSIIGTEKEESNEGNDFGG